MKKSTLPAAVFLMTLGFLFTSQLARAQEVSITPPPLAYPKFSEPNTTQGKVTGTYLSTSGIGFELTGIGASYTGRTVLDRTKDDLGQGLGFSGGFFLISGTTFDGFILSTMGNYERELFKKSGSTLIGFAGPNFTYASFGSDTFDLELYLVGLQLGLQYSYETNDLIISPFFMYTSAIGGVWINGNGFSTDSQTTQIGFDVLMVSRGITLSGILQEAFGDETTSSDTLILQFSYSFGPQSKDSKSDTPAKTARRSGSHPAGVPGDSIWFRYRGG